MEHHELSNKTIYIALNDPLTIFLHAKSVLCLSFYIHVVVQFFNTFNKVPDMQLSNKEDLFIFFFICIFFELQIDM